jgi:hemerythrin-like domain-containing protein
MNKAAREVARSLHHYFDEALDFHRNGQEAHLFPVLEARVHDAEALRVLLAAFQKEHRALEGAWETLRANLTGIALCRPAKLSIDNATGFVAMYRHHVVTETRHLLAFGSTPSHLAEWVGIAPWRPCRPAYCPEFGGLAAHSDRRWRIDA